MMPHGHYTPCFRFSGEEVAVNADIRRQNDPRRNVRYNHQFERAVPQDGPQHYIDAHQPLSGRHRLVQQGVDVGAPLDDAADQGREELRIGVEVAALFGLTEAVALKLPQDEFGLLAVQVDLIERLDRRDPPPPRAEAGCAGREWAGTAKDGWAQGD